MAVHYINAIPVSSMAKIFPEAEPEGTPISRLSCLANEPLSFQVAYKLISNQVFTVGTYVRIESELPISRRAVSIAFLLFPASISISVSPHLT